MKHRSKYWQAQRLRVGLCRRAITLRRDRYRHFRRASQPTSASETIKAPQVLSFKANGKETIDFIDLLRRKALTKRGTIRNGVWAERHLFVDLSTIERISVPAAVILSAEFQRWSLLKGIQLRPRKMKAWKPRVRQLLEHLGTFDLLGIGKKPRERYMSDSKIVILPLRSGIKTDQERISRLQDDLHAFGLMFKHRNFIFDGLSEAILNSIDHAYAVERSSTSHFPTAGHRWWATSCYDPNTDCLRFFAYDQGVGIRATLEDKAEWRPLLDALLSAVGVVKTDAQVIAAAFEVGRTRTGLQERGKGLDQMARVVRSAGGGFIRVLSGRGDVQGDGHGNYLRRTLHGDLGGTLIEWSLPYAVLSRGPGDDE